MVKVVKKWIKKFLIKNKARNMIVQLGKNVELDYHNTYEGHNAIYNRTFFKGELGYGSYIGSECHINATIGRYCSIAGSVHTVNGKHPSKEFVSTHPAFFSTQKQAGFSYVNNEKYSENCYADLNHKRDVIIGNDVWVGFGCTIIAGVTIGDGAILAAGAVITKNVPAYSVVGGVPAKVIKYRFTPAEIEFLLSFRWWDKSPEWIQRNVNNFENINDFKKLNKII